MDNLRTWPVYHPSFEPKGYREELLRRGPQPLIEPESLHGEQDWIEAGRIVFEALDTPASRTADPAVIAHFTSAAAIDRHRDAHHDVLIREGVLLDYRWVVERDGTLKLSLSSCFGCHSRLMEDGSLPWGAPSNYDLGDSEATGAMLAAIAVAPELAPGARFYAQFGVPWRKHDPHARLRSLAAAELGAELSQPDGAPPGTMFARYAILVEYADSSVFGPHSMLPDGQPFARVRPSDEAMYALALYLESLETPPSPIPFDALARRGEAVFREERCADCHPPPHYTNNLLVAVDEWDPSEPRPSEVSRRGVGTDPSLALETRKGTGMYRVPSLRGLWYRGLYEHSGSAGSLEEWFDAARLEPDHVPGGWRGPGVRARAIPGHEFGLELSVEDKRALFAFLRTL